jgi:hypothetical protein
MNGAKVDIVTLAPRGFNKLLICFGTIRRDL